MTEGLKFAISLEDHVSPSAEEASKALKHLQTEFTASKSKLGLLQQQLAAAKQLGDVEGYRKYSELVSEARRETFALGEALVHAGGPAKEMGEKLFRVVEPAEVARHALEGVEEGLRGMATALKGGDVAGAIEGATEALAGLASALDLVVPGLGQAAAAAIKMGGAVVGAFVEIEEEGVKTALEVGETNERLGALFDVLGKGPDAGAKTIGLLNDLEHKLPQSRDQLAKWTAQFERFGVTDLGELRGQIEATASAQALMTEGGAELYTKLAQKIRDAAEGGHKLKMGKDPLRDLGQLGVHNEVADKLGLTVKALDAQLKAGTLDAGKFGKALEDAVTDKGKGPLEAMGNELGTLKAKGLDVFRHLFDGIDTTPITDALKSILELGNQGEPSGRALKEGIGKGIQGIIGWLGEMLIEAQVVFIDLETYAVTHRAQLAMVANGFRLVGEAILGTVHAVESLLEAAAAPPPMWLKLLLGGLSSGALTGGDSGPTAPAHAAGGLVGRPAPGEFFASVAPGEMIIPERQTRQIMGGGIGGGTREMAMAANSNGQPAGAGVHIEHLELTVQAAGGVTDATSLSVTGLSLALERLKLVSGR